MVNWVRVLVAKPGKALEVCELPDNLKAFELTICGSIEIIETERPGCLIIYNGNNKLSLKPVNRSEIQGTFIIARVKQSDLVSLNDEDIDVLCKIYA